MNISLQTNNLNSINQYKNNNLRQNNKNMSQPAFTGGFDKATTYLSEKYTEKLYTSGLAKYLTKFTEKLDDVVNHMIVVGSTVISGMYMTQTLRNDKLDKEKRNTLALNQGLTYACSTFGFYTVDRKIRKKWNDLTMNYAKKASGIEDLDKKLEEHNNKLQAEKKVKMNLAEFLEIEHGDAKLATKIKGMGVLRQLLVFGTIYRFLAPVVVTPFANWLGRKYSEHKKAKAAEIKA